MGGAVPVRCVPRRSRYGISVTCACQMTRQQGVVSAVVQHSRLEASPSSLCPKPDAKTRRDSGHGTRRAPGPRAVEDGALAPALTLVTSTANLPLSTMLACQMRSRERASHTRSATCRSQEHGNTYGGCFPQVTVLERSTYDAGGNLHGLVPAATCRVGSAAGTSLHPL
jgi:hypothetical protein